MAITTWALVGILLFALCAHAQETTSVKADRYREMEEDDLICKKDFTALSDFLSNALIKRYRSHVSANVEWRGQFFRALNLF